MIFLYTGARLFNTPQNNPDLSLGGNVSSSIIANSKINNLFSDLSGYARQNLSSETKGIILKNTTGGTVTNVLFGFRYPQNPAFLLEIALVQLDAGNQFMETINSSADSPYAGTFYEAFISDNENHSLSIGDMIAGKMYGIWIRRTMKQTIPFILSPTQDTELDLLKSFAVNNTKKVDNIILKLLYDN